MLCDYGCGKEAKYKLKNGKWCCCSSFNKCSKVREKNSYSKKGIRTNFSKCNETKKCPYCEKEFNIIGFNNHIKNCYMNPINIRYCEKCGKIIKNNKTRFCSAECSNKAFPRKQKITSYKTLCFKYKEKKCIVCGEDKIVEVHHYDENHKNNDIKNLIPLCPTHHKYMHSKYKSIIKNIVDKYYNGH